MGFFQGTNSFIEGCEALRLVVEHIPDLQRAEAIKFPALRKYLATVVQVFFANRMSQDEDIIFILLYLQH